MTDHVYKVSIDKEMDWVQVECEEEEEIILPSIPQAKTIAVEILRLIGIHESGKGVKGLYVNFENPGEQDAKEGKS